MTASPRGTLLHNDLDLTKAKLYGIRIPPTMPCIMLNWAM